MTSLDRTLSERFKCGKCGAKGGGAQRFTATGTGFSKIFDIQYKQFVTVSCLACGYTEMYNPEILERSGNLGTVLDVIFGS